MSPLASPVSAGRERDQGSHQPQGGAGANEHPGAAQPALGVEVKVGQGLVELVLAAGGAGVGDDEGERVGHRGAAGHPADGGGGRLAVADGQRAAGRLGACGSVAKRRPRPGAQLDEKAAELEDDQREREQGEDEHRNLQRAGDVEDRLVDVAGAHGAGSLAGRERPAAGAECSSAASGARPRRSPAAPSPSSDDDRARRPSSRRPWWCAWPPRGRGGRHGRRRDAPAGLARGGHGVECGRSAAPVTSRARAAARAARVDAAPGRGPGRWAAAAPGGGGAGPGSGGGGRGVAVAGGVVVAGVVGRWRRRRGRGRGGTPSSSGPVPRSGWSPS